MHSEFIHQTVLRDLWGFAACRQSGDGILAGVHNWDVPIPDKALWSVETTSIDRRRQLPSHMRNNDSVTNRLPFLLRPLTSRWPTWHADAETYMAFGAI